MVTNTKEYMNEYMKNYVLKNSFKVTCDVCDGCYKKYHEYKHKQSKRHKIVELKIKEAQKEIKAN